MNKKSVKAKRWLAVVAGSAIVMSASVAQAAVVEVEGNDTFATANAGGTGSITGTVGHATETVSSAAANLQDVDIFSFELLAGQAFSSSITYSGIYNPADANPIITLYMENGADYLPVASTDPQSFGTSFNFTPWASGTYYLAVMGDFNQGVDAFGNFQSDFSFLSSETVTGTSWDHFNNGSFTSFNYEVVTTGAVPIPAAVWLFGSGLLGLVGVARRRANKV